MNIEGLVQKDDLRRKADTPRGEAVRRESPNKSRSAIKPASPKRVLQGTLGKKIVLCIRTRRTLLAKSNKRAQRI